MTGRKWDITRVSNYVLFFSIVIYLFYQIISIRAAYFTRESILKSLRFTEADILFEYDVHHYEDDQVACSFVLYAREDEIGFLRLEGHDSTVLYRLSSLGAELLRYQYCVFSFADAEKPLISKNCPPLSQKEDALGSAEPAYVLYSLEPYMNRGMISSHEICFGFTGSEKDISQAQFVKYRKELVVNGKRIFVFLSDDEAHLSASADSPAH